WVLFGAVRPPRSWAQRSWAGSSSCSVFCRRARTSDRMSTISLIQPLRDVPFAFVDVETTGASADFGHRIIEIGIARVEGGRVVAEYEHLLDPQRKISAGATAFTGITQAKVTGQPTFADQLPGRRLLIRGR